MKVLFFFICSFLSCTLTKGQSIVFSENFIDNRNNWDVGAEKDEISLIKNGKYQIKITDKKSSHWFENKFNFSNYSNSKLETVITQPNRFTDNDIVGVFFASSEKLIKYYLFLFDTKVGSYKILKSINEEITILKDWTSSESIGKKFKVEISKKSNLYSFYVNDNFLTIQRINEEFGDRFVFNTGPLTQCEIEYVTIESNKSGSSNYKISGASYFNLNNACSYDRRINDERILITEPKEETKDLMEQIFEYSGLYTEIKTYGINTNDIGISLILDGKRYILLNEKLLNSLQKSDKNYWPTLSVIAHEIGHHLVGHTLYNEISKSNYVYQDWEKEWIADFFSGYILSKMGASLGEAISGIKKMIPEDYYRNKPGKATHPDR